MDRHRGSIDSRKFVVSATYDYGYNLLAIVK